MGTMEKVRRRGLWVVVAVLLGLASGSAFSVVNGGGFSATARLFASTSATDAVAAAQGDIAGQSRIKTYAVLATGQLLLERAAERSRTGLNGAEIADRLTVVPVPGTVLLEISVHDRNANTAAKLADSVANELTELTSQVETPINGGPRAQGLLTIQPASSGVQKVGRIAPAPIALGVAAGLFIGLVLAASIPQRKGHRSARSATSAEVDATAAPPRSEKVGPGGGWS